MAALRSTRRRLHAAGLAAALCGCAAAPAPDAHTPAAIERPAPPRPFVSPYSYEWFVRAELLAARGEHARAAEAYRMALTSADEDPYVLARLAEALDLSGERQAADEALAAGLEIDPESEAVWLARARIAERRGALQHALEAYERAESAAPHASDAPLALAALLERTGHRERANAVLARHAARNPEAERALLRARVQSARERGDAVALAAAARRMGERGADPELARSVAAELFARGQSARAARLLAALPATDGDARLRRDVLLALAQADALELLLTTTRPEALGGPVAVAEAYLAIDRPERALEALAEQSAAAEPDPQRRSVAHARALLALGRPAEAALIAARVPESSAHRRAALETLRRALETAGLPALARDAAAGP